MGGPERNPEDDLLVREFSAKDPEEGRPLVLIVEDSRSDVFLIREALNTAEVKAEIRIIDNGDSATKFFDSADADQLVPIPKLVLLDLNLPKKRGDEVLRYLRNSVRCRDVLVVIVSTSDSGRDRAAVEPLGVAGYFRKPTNFADFMKLGYLVKQLLNNQEPI